MGSYLRHAFQEGSAEAVACLPIPVAQVFSLVASTAFSCKKIDAFSRVPAK
jgi:hypothetical protein